MTVCAHNFMYSWLYALITTCTSTHDCIRPWMHAPMTTCTLTYALRHSWRCAVTNAYSNDCVHSLLHANMNACNHVSMHPHNVPTHDAFKSACTPWLHDCSISRITANAGISWLLELFWLEKFNKQKQYVIKKIRSYHYKQDTIGIHEFEKYYPEKRFLQIDLYKKIKPSHCIAWVLLLIVF